MSIEDRKKRVETSKTFRNIRKFYNLSGKAVLDAGCGFGEYLKFFGKGSVGISTTAQEIDRIKKDGLNAVLGNAEKLQNYFAEYSFDAVWANNIIEHLLSPHSFLVTLKRVCRNDAIMIAGVPVIPKINSLLRFKFFRGALASNHINFFTKKSLYLTIERAGWKVKEIRPFLFRNSFLDALFGIIAPHIYVVALNDPKFVYSPKKVGEWINDGHYEELLSITKQSSSNIKTE